MKLTRLSPSFCAAFSLLAQLGGATTGIDLNLDSQESIKNAANIAADGMMQYYTGYRPGDVPGNLPDPYYWWEAGAMFGSLIEYWYYTGDDQFNNKTTEAMLHQVGPHENYMPPNQTRTLGNDDQAFWGMAALTAAEVKYPNPPPDKPQWLALAQAVFNTQAPRWDPKTCNGGLRWQIFPFNAGWSYKNTISNGCFFNMGARLAVYTNNDTYADWANKVWEWTYGVGLISDNYHFFDGTDVGDNCSAINHLKWTYNAGVYLYGAANMYNYTDGSDLWRQRIENILKEIDIFFRHDNIMSEFTCEKNSNCNVDQKSFKAYLSSWMAASIPLAPFTHDQIMEKLRASAKAAALQCSGPNHACGLHWIDRGDYDGSTGVGEQMSAMQIFQVQLIEHISQKTPRVTNSTGGISPGNPSAGTETTDKGSVGLDDEPITTGDKAGAGILTAIVCLAAISGAYFMVS